MMSKMKRVAMNVSIVAGLILGLAACDNELNTIGSDILGADQLNDRIKKQEFDVVAFNELLGPVQTNNFNSMPLGSYTDPVYGRTDYGFVSQLSLATTDPDFGINPVLDSVVITIPYFSTPIDFEDETTIYELDSIYGNGSYDLQIYRNNYFLNDFDPDNIENPAIYYSDLAATIDSQKGALIFEKVSFKPSEKEVVLTDFDTDESETVVLDRLTPRFRETIGKRTGTTEQVAQINFWENLIVSQEGTINLESNNNFRNYFRGLFFNVSNANGTDNLVHLDLADATIELFLSINITDTSDLDEDGDTTDLIPLNSTFTINFGGENSVGLIDTTGYNQSIFTDIQMANNDVVGEERLYLKGGPGSMVLLDLFGPDLDMNGEADDLTQLISNNWLINEASITFFVDQAAVVAGETEPERIIIYNFDDNTILADFAIGSTGTGLSSNLTHLGRLERVDDEDESSQGIKYKMILTNHVNSIVNGDIENVRLGLSVTQNVNIISNAQIKNPNITSQITTGSAVSHEGTILHGNRSTDLEKRLKLEIFYTEVN